MDTTYSTDKRVHRSPDRGTGCCRRMSRWRHTLAPQMCTPLIMSFSVPAPQLLQDMLLLLCNLYNLSSSCAGTYQLQREWNE